MKSILTAWLLLLAVAFPATIELTTATDPQKAGIRTSLGLGNVENTALSTWAGSTNITTLGTIGTGTWQGSIIGPTYLGTGSSISTKFLRGDGTWQTISSGGTIVSDTTGLTGATTINNIVGITSAGYAAIGAPDANTYYIISDAAAGTLAQFDATTSAQLAGVISDETGTGALVFGTSPTITLGNATGLPVGGISATGTPSGTTYLRGDGTWATPAGGGGSGDIVSDLVSAEISVTTTATATISRMHVCSGTTADYTLTLPAASGNAGKLIGVRMAVGLTKLVTIDADGTELIDGTQTRIMWAGEAAILLCDGTGWSKISGKSIPMRARMFRDAALTGITDNTVTVIPLDALDYAMPAAMEDGTNDRITILRPGTYEIQAVVLYDALTAASLNTQAGIYKNGASVDVDSRQGSSGAYPNPRCFSVLALAAGDYLALSTYHVSGGTEALYVLNNTNALNVIESPTW